MNQDQIIHTLQIKLQHKIEEEEEEVLPELGQIAHNVANEIKKNTIDISSLNPIFQELIKVQSEKTNGIRYHPM
jgi:hypothetical protein